MCRRPVAYEAISRHRPDVAIIDRKMPGLDGIGLYKQLKAARLPTRVVIACVRFRAECLNQHWFLTLADARSSTAQLGSPVARAGTLSKSKVILLAVRSTCFCAGITIRTCHRHYGARPVGELWKHRGQTVATATSSRRNIELFCQSLQSLPAGVVGLRACVLPKVRCFEEKCR
ncbi:hypothetical protein B5K03_27165 [Rhizobium phaseoli]|nr:hypothetical protein B5K03_27165 [Rhizobium phaseoli]